MPENKIIAVVIPTFNRADCLKKLAAQLCGQQLSGLTLEIVVAVAGHSDGTWEMLDKEFPEIHKLKWDKDWWFTRSVNKGFAYAEAQLNPDYGLILNDDLEIEPDYIQTLYRACTSLHSDKVIMGSATLTAGKPTLVYFGGTEKIIRWRFKSVNYFPVFSPFVPAEFTGIRPSESLPGRGTFAPFAVFKSLNYLDEVFPQYASDDDFCLRALKKGYKVYISLDARVYSHIEKTGAGASYIKYPLGVFLKALFNKHSFVHLGTALRMVARHGDKRLLPLGMAIAVAGKFKAYFFNRKHY